MNKIFKKQPTRNYIIYSAIILGGIFIDQLSKWLVVKYMDMYESIPLIKNFLHITYTTNDGAAFGMMDGEAGRAVFITISVLAILGFCGYLFLGHAENMLYGVSLAMVISGGIGNMIDRWGFGFYVNPSTGMGEVVDFIDFCGIWNAIFNGADSFVCVGAGMLILALVIDLVKEFKAEKAKKLQAGEPAEATETTEE